jgi:YD repeat-containing protein
MFAVPPAQVQRCALIAHPFVHAVLRRSTIACAMMSLAARMAAAQTAPPERSESSIRVNVTMNADGSRTTYQFDTANHRASAVTTEPNGKVRGKTNYRLDDAGRFGSGVSFSADGKFKFKSIYKYDGNGRMEEETQLGKDDAVLNRIVYSYDASGRQTGYAIYDAAGKLIGRTGADSGPSAAPPAKKK